MGSAADGVAFRVLGPLEVVVDGRPVALGSPKARLLLAAFLVDANSVVSTDRLVEALWGERPPSRALSALQQLVHRLRSLTRSAHLPDADVLVTRPPGYVLRVEPGCYDAARFEELVVDAQHGAQGGDPDAALGALDEALALWRGPAFAEFASEEFARAEATRLEVLRLVAIEERVEAKLALGRHDEVTGELDALVTEFPYRERLWGQLMLALYRSGRQADALRAYGRVRTLLAEELGIDPGAPLRSLEEAILLQKPELDWVPPKSKIAAAREVWRPALPMALARDDLLVGRRGEIAWLDELLVRAEGGAVGVLVRGERGSGRTTLVVDFGRRAFQQGCAVLYGATSRSRLSGLQPLLDAVTVLDSPATTFDGEVERFAAELGEIVGKVARSTAKPLVLIVDDVDRAGPETVEVLQQLVAASEPGGLLVVATTAAAGHGDDDACRWWAAERTLTPFNETEVAALLELWLGEAPSPELAAVVWEETDGNPRRVGELAARLAEAELDQQVERAVARATAAQRDLRTVHGEIATSVGVRAHRRSLARQAEPPEPAGSAACPYKGLASFEAADEAFFCGRDRLVDELVARLAVSRFVAVVGPSGSGKSSLVRAGLLPALRRGALPGSRDWDTVLVTPGDQPGLERAIVGTPRRLTLFVDHLEELFTAGCDDPAQTAFLDAIVRAATTPDSSANVVVAFRADYYGRFAAFPTFARLLADTQLLVGPMTDAELHAAIEEPAHRAALTLEDELADAIAADVAGQPGALPLLSTALLETWVRRRGRVLTHAGYHDAGGVSGAVASLAEDTYLQFTPDEQRACRLLLLRLAEPGEGPDDVRRRVPLVELGDTRVLDILVARRLVTTGDGTAEVAHEALLREWPRLRGWLEEDRDGRRLHHRVATAAIDWDTSGRDPTELYRGTRLDAALEWSAIHPGEANPLEREFLETAGAAQDHELRTARRTAHRLRSLTVGLAVLLIVALVAATVALVQRGDANRQATRANDAATVARATQLATLARTLPTNRNDLALLLGVEAQRLGPSLTTDGGLEAALTHRPAGLERVLHFDIPVAYPSLSDDHRLIAAPGHDGNVRIYNFATGKLLRTLHGNGEPTFVSLFNSDASLVVTGGFHGKITIWRVATGKPIGPPIKPGGNVVYGAFTGATGLYTVSDTGVFAQWDFHDPKHPNPVSELFRFPVRANDVPVAAFGGGGDRNLMAAAGSSSQHTTIFDVATHRQVADVSGTPGRFSPDGSTLATTMDKSVVLWNASTGAELGALSLGSHLAAEASARFSPDGRLLSVSDQDDAAIRVFNLATGTQVGDPLLIHSAFAFAGAFLPGDRLVTFGRDEAAVWRLDTRVPALETDLGGHTSGPPGTENQNGAFGQFTPDGTETITVGTADHRVLAFDAATGTPRGVLFGGHEVTKTYIAFSPDAKTIASGGLDGSFTLWDRSSGRQLSHNETGATDTTFVAWDPHRPVLVTSNAPDSLRFWDVTDPRHPIEQRRRSLNTPAGLLSFSPDGRLLVDDAFSTLTATVYDVATGHKLLTVGGDNTLNEVSFTPDSRTVAAVIDDITGGKVVLYDTTTWHHRTLLLSYIPLALAFVDGGTRFVTAGILHDGRVDLWDTATLQPVGESLTIATDDNYSVIANPRGTKVVLGSYGDITPVLDVDPHDWQRTACRLAGRNLTRTESAEYLPGQAYRKTCPQWPAGR